MKVLSLRQPWASLVKEKIKTIETRSWYTNYRGELYIHASKTKVSSKDKKIMDLVNLLNTKDLEYGFIILKCKLVNCIYMDEAFINLIKNNDVEYLCGEYKSGRYAWILEDIEPLKNPTYVNGKLGIWNY
jgi:hypothetical protein